MTGAATAGSSTRGHRGRRGEDTTKVTAASTTTDRRNARSDRGGDPRELHLGVTGGDDAVPRHPRRERRPRRLTGNTTVGGTLGVTGATTLSTLAVSGASTLTGNTTVGGTLGVTGATTLASSLGVTGDVAVNTNKFTVSALNGNTAIAGTLAGAPREHDRGVTGATTLAKLPPGDRGDDRRRHFSPSAGPRPSLGTPPSAGLSE